MAIARRVIKDGSEPKMGVLAPRVWDKIDAMLWVQVRVSAMIVDIARSQMALCRCPSQTMSDTTRSLH